MEAQASAVATNHCLIVPSLCSCVLARLRPLPGFELGALSFPRLLEISQIGRRLVLLGGHQVAVRAHHVDLFPDADMLVPLGTNGLEPYRIAHAMIALDDCPGTGERMVDGCDFVLENVRIGL